jgi:hypothetical protein
MLALLKTGNLTLIPTNEVIYEFVIQISTGQLKFEQIVEWLKANTVIIPIIHHISSVLVISIPRFPVQAAEIAAS